MLILYVFLRVLVRITLRIFYKEFTVHGRERLPRKGPMIVVANHPNTLMDPLIVASLLRQTAGFMGNGSLFRSKPLAKLLRFFHVIPVYRKQDIRPGENIDNQDNFEHARAYLGQGGTLLIFPEGTSYAEKKLRELRTGAARIAMSFEAERNFQGGLVMMPVALNYSAPTRSRTRIRIDVGTPIPVAPYAELHAQDSFQAVRALTEAVRKQIEERMVVLDDKEQETMLTHVIRLHRETLQAGDDHKGHDAQIVEQAIADGIRKLKQTQPDAYTQLRDRCAKWFAMVDRLQIREGFFRQSFQNWSGTTIWALTLAFLVLTSPLYLLGLLTNWLPYWFPGWVAPKIADDIEYHAPTMMVIGMFLFPIWYTLLILSAWLGLGLTGWPLAIFGTALPILGIFALNYAQLERRFRGLTALLHIRGKKESILQNLQSQRTQLLQDLKILLDS